MPDISGPEDRLHFAGNTPRRGRDGWRAPRSRRARRPRDPALYGSDLSGALPRWRPESPTVPDIQQPAGISMIVVPHYSRAAGGGAARAITSGVQRGAARSAGRPDRSTSLAASAPHRMRSRSSSSSSSLDRRRLALSAVSSDASRARGSVVPRRERHLRDQGASHRGGTVSCRRTGSTGARRSMRPRRRHAATSRGCSRSSSGGLSAVTF